MAQGIWRTFSLHPRALIVRALLPLALLLCGIAGTTVTTHAQARANAATAPTPITPISHVVIFMLENHDFTNYFGRYPGVQNAVTLPHASNPFPHDIDHSGADFAAAADGGQMDEFPPPGQVQYTQADIPIWWEYAQQFGLGDNFFSSLATSSTPNHIALITAGQSGGAWGTDSSRGSCGGASNNVLVARSLSGQEYFTTPCYNIPANLPALLTANNLSWRYYAGAGIFDAPSYIQSLHGSPYDVHNPTQFSQDIAKGALATVSWVVPPNTDHPPTPVEPAQNWVSQQVNALMQSSYWQNTAVFVTWDDWGGQYDPVYPPQLDGTGLGARVPFLVISRYTPAGTLSHNLGEFTSFAKFIEANWQLNSISPRDALSQIDNLMDYFDFTQPPRAPVIVSPIPYQSVLKVPSGSGANGVVYPFDGTTATNFTYSIVYVPSGTPTVHNVTIDGATYAMINKGRTVGGTLWQYTTKLGVGPHTCTFTFSASSGAVTFPDNGVPFPVPTVHPFTLSKAKAPSQILPGKTVTFSAFYASPQGKAPTVAEVDLDGVRHAMTASGSNYTSGVTYTYTTTAPGTGVHNTRFRFDDGSGAWIINYDQPVVTPITLTGSGVSPTSGTPSTRFTFSTTYTEVSGSAPSQAFVYVDKVAHPMSYISGSYATGALFQAHLTLAAGSHTFAFVFADASSSWGDPLGPAVYKGPSVSATASATNSNSATTAPPTIIPPSHDVNPDYPLPPDSDG